LWRCVQALETHDRELRFWHIYRPFRDYRPARHHLRESMAFALGGRGHGPRRAPQLASQRTPLTPKAGRVVVHFEGGWRLKELPPARRGPLLRKLQAAGFAPVILGAPEPSCPDIPARPYTDLASFRALVGSALALVGTDSFPAHCAQALGVPTVQLFGATAPAHARGAESPRYRLLHRPLPCVPCVDRSCCALDGGAVCHAHADDDTILAALREVMADTPAATTEAPRENRESRS
jgi:ADP-heptose:LPS heptosyltransferase